MLLISMKHSSDQVAKWISKMIYQISTRLRFNMSWNRQQSEHTRMGRLRGSWLCRRPLVLVFQHLHA